MVRFILQLIVIALVGCIGYLFASIVLNIAPNQKTLKYSNKKKSGPDIDSVLRPVYEKLAKFMYMEETRERTQRDILMRAGIDLTPKEVLARSILGLVIGLLFTFWSYLMNNTFLMIVGVILGAALYGISSSQANERIKEKDAEVKKELPKFVSTIVVALKSDNNIIKVIESYTKDAKPALRSDLEILLSQMQTGNIEQALRNFDARMGASEISSLCTSLIYIENGVDQTVALQYLESDMRQADATNRRLEIEKLPGRMRRSFVPVGIILIAMFFYTIFLQIFQNFTMFV